MKDPWSRTRIRWRPQQLSGSAARVLAPDKRRLEPLSGWSTIHNRTFSLFQLPGSSQSAFAGVAKYVCPLLSSGITASARPNMAYRRFRHRQSTQRSLRALLIPERQYRIDPAGSGGWNHACHHRYRCQHRNTCSGDQQIVSPNFFCIKNVNRLL